MDRFALSYANSKRPCQLYEDLYHALPNKFRNESQGRLAPWFTKSVFTVFRLDSTTISLCLKISDWAQHPRRKGRIKLHALLNNDPGLPEGHR